METKTQRDYQHVCVAICTRQRPKMLARCLEGVLRQTLPAGWRMSVLVVENNEEPSEQLSVSSRQTQPGTELYYFHETTLGISSARNRAVEEALNLNADWIAFIDDDEVPDESWLK
ncbi:MAG TPA: glycosyltransferase family 2 protein, partial [Chromatiales bacterium]|nr:glycosyltransferase family 2 protein [Chromatiales bacterium]